MNTQLGYERTIITANGSSGMTRKHDNSGGSRKIEHHEPTTPEPTLGAKRRITITMDEAKDEKEVELPFYPFYAVILPGLAGGKLQTYLRDHWLTLDALTGETILLLTPVIPTHVTTEWLNWWKARMSDDLYARFKRKINSGIDKGAEDRIGAQTYEKAASYGITATMLPALIMSTVHTADATRYLIVRVDPEWDEVTIGRFFQALIVICSKRAVEQDPERRLDKVKDELQREVDHLRKPVPVVTTQSSIRTIVLTGLGQLAGAILPMIIKAVMGL